MKFWCHRKRGAVVLISLGLFGCTSTEPTPVKEIQVESSDPVTQAYAVEDLEIGNAQALDASGEIEGASLDSNDQAGAQTDSKDPVFSVSQFRDKVILANFWSTSCAPCWRRMLEVQKLSEDFEPFGLIVANINSGDTLQVANAYMRDKGRILSMLQFNDPSRMAAVEYNVNTLPMTLLFDKSGQEVKRYGLNASVEQTHRDLELLLK